MQSMEGGGSWYIWKIGKWNKINFWKDAWLSFKHILLDKATNHIDLSHLNRSVVDYT